jgi:hypothetical protein
MAFEDIGANVLELKSITFLERKYLGCLSSRDKKRFLFYDDTGVSAFVWDYFSQSYVKGDEIVCSMVQAGFDRDQRLVILDAENNLYIEDLPDAYSYRAEFVGVPESADFGEPVAAALRLDVPEGLGFLLKVELFGDVTFADESKVKVLGSDFGGGLIPVRVLSPTRGKVVVSKL